VSTDREPATPPSPSSRPSQHRVALVESVRLVILGLTTSAGWGIAQVFQLTDQNLSIALALGALVGYVLGGVFGRSTAVAVSAVERRFQKASAAEILAGTIGVILGLFLAFLLSFPLLRLAPAAAYPIVAFVYLLLGFIGYRVGATKHDDFFSMLGMKPRAAGGGSDLAVLDTSALVDGRVVDVVRTGFLTGTLLVADGVLNELRSIGDASDPARRERGRRGLEALERLQGDPSVDVVLVDRVPEFPTDDVDAALVRLARERRAALVTNDSQLAKVAEAVGVPVRSVAKLAVALRPAVAPGQDLDIQLTKTGREAGQGVGHLEDGTMVVVHGGGERIGQKVHVRVTNVLNTANGRLLFAELAEPARG
jgi:uncharacterized protein YacL